MKEKEDIEKKLNDQLESEREKDKKLAEELEQQKQKLENVSVFIPLPKSNCFNWLKYEAFADGRFNVAKISVFDRVEDIVGKGDSSGYQGLSSFQLFFFQKASEPWSYKVGMVW